MKKFLLQIVLVSFSYLSLALTGKKPIHDEPLFQLSCGAVYSSIDLSRYNSSVSYRGLHTRLVTHLGSVFFLSTEYSTFPVHEALPSWDDIHTRKFDINGQVSFMTQNKLTHIYVLAGVNRHQWKGRRTAFSDMGQLGKGLPAGTYVDVKRWGINIGCGFTQLLYENIGVFGDFRFCFGNANDFEKVRIFDVMTTIGINFSIPHPAKSNGKKTFGIDKKIYKWTEKGAK